MLLLFACVPQPEVVAVDRPTPPPHTVFASASEALPTVLVSNPRILGVGELHATTVGPTVPSTLHRFTTDLLPVLAPNTTDLVLETWRLDGRCGAQEEAVAAKVEDDTRRPEATKSELVLLAEAALAANVRPHDLALSCDEYASLTGPDGQIVYDTLLRLLTDKLFAFAVKGLDTPDATMVLYGGAVHNDLTPREGMASWSYGPSIRAKDQGAYVELDLYVPELITPSLTEPAWEPLLALTGPDHVVLYEREPRSFVLLLETTPAPR